jgi:putative NADPH-quinone reductase
MSRREQIMGKRILIIQGHPDPAGGHFAQALQAAYADAAVQAGHEVRHLEVARLDFPLLQSKQAFHKGAVPAPILASQQALEWAEHLVLIYPLWLGSMPALLKAFLEQVLRPNFAFAETQGFPHGRLRGRSARVVVTMGMPGVAYRWFYRAHSLKSLQRNILQFCGFAPVRASVIGSVESPDPSARQRWLQKLAKLGREAG